MSFTAWGRMWENEAAASLGYRVTLQKQTKKTEGEGRRKERCTVDWVSELILQRCRQNSLKNCREVELILDNVAQEILTCRRAMFTIGYLIGHVRYGFWVYGPRRK